jgi:hypothetical protein
VSPAAAAAESFTNSLRDTVCFVIVTFVLEVRLTGNNQVKGKVLNYQSMMVYVELKVPPSKLR